MRSFLVYTREDVRDTIRERRAHGLVGIVVGFALLVTVNLIRSSTASGGGPTTGLVARLFPLLALLVPVLALGVFAPSVAERRATGALSVVLGLPVARRTVLLGSIVARSILVGVAATAGLALPSLLGYAFGLSVDPVRLLLGVVLLCLLGVVFTVFAVVVSARIRSVTLAMLVALGLWVVFAFQLWDYLPIAVVYLRHGLSLPAQLPGWVEFVIALNPLLAYANLVDGLAPALEGGGLVSPSGEPAFYHHPLFGLVVLIGWVLGTMYIGVRGFARQDI